MKIVLRPVEESDLQWLLKYRNDPILNINFNQPTPLSYKDQFNWYIEQVLTKKTFAYIAMLENIPIGYISLQNINWITRNAEISYFVIEEFNKDTFAELMHISMLRTGFKFLNLHKIYTVCFAFNDSYKILEKLGFKVEGVIRDHCFKDGLYFNSKAMSIFEGEYESIS